MTEWLFEVSASEIINLISCASQEWITSTYGVLVFTFWIITLHKSVINWFFFYGFIFLSTNSVYIFYPPVFIYWISLLLAFSKSLKQWTLLKTLTRNPDDLFSQNFRKGLTQIDFKGRKFQISVLRFSASRDHCQC